MTFEWGMVLFSWFSALAFAGVSAFKIATLARLPLNVRWELYPVPHETAEKRRYGGSYMEEVDWARARPAAARLPALCEMAAEILTLKKVRENNTHHLWPLSLAMHWGLYLYFGWLFLLVVENLIPWTALPALTVVVGVAAMILGAAGALGLAVKRMTDPDLALYTTPLEYANLVFIASFFVAGLASWFGDATFTAHRAYIGSVIFFNPVTLPPAVATQFLLFELFMVYMPFTKLIHYFAKYFTFDLTLWDDKFKIKGSAADRRVIAQLEYTVDWSAPHIATGRTWLEQAESTSSRRAKP